jgi:SNF2 family DNA or RNA helicase
VDQGLESGQKMLVFSQFTSFLKLIASRLKKDGISFYTITGSMPKKRRLELVDRFNEDDVPVFLISLKAGGTGLNLTGASIVIHADPWWNAAAEHQATDRAHRIGQQHAVSVYKVIAKDTIEERIVDLQERKSALAETLMAGADTSLASLSADDLIGLLS